MRKQCLASLKEGHPLTMWSCRKCSGGEEKQREVGRTKGLWGAGVGEDCLSKERLRMCTSHSVSEALMCKDLACLSHPIGYHKLSGKVKELKSIC